MPRLAKLDLDFPEAVKLPELSALFADFSIFENGDRQWLIKCRTCNATWALTRKSPPHVGNILALLNHAASH